MGCWALPSTNPPKLKALPACELARRSSSWRWQRRTLLFEVADLGKLSADVLTQRSMNGTYPLVLGIQRLGVHARPAAVVGLDGAPLLLLERRVKDPP